MTQSPPARYPGAFPNDDNRGRSPLSGTPYSPPLAGDPGQDSVADNDNWNPCAEEEGREPVLEDEDDMWRSLQAQYPDDPTCSDDDLYKHI